MSDQPRLAKDAVGRRAKARRWASVGDALLVLLVVAACGGGNPDAPAQPAGTGTIDPVTCNSTGNCR
jgi:hypothetical protein